GLYGAFISIRRLYGYPVVNGFPVVSSFGGKITPVINVFTIYIDDRSSMYIRLGCSPVASGQAILGTGIFKYNFVSIFRNDLVLYGYPALRGKRVNYF